MKRRMGTLRRTPWLPVTMLAALLGALLAALPAQPAAAQGTPGATGCVFVLGFAALRNAIPQVVGSCTDNESFSPANGDALQSTTGGLLVWRKSDNWTAFTDGFRSWVQGPLGLQMRLNTQRFWWEGNPQGLAIVPPPQAGDRCHTSGLILSTGQGDAGAGQQGLTMRFTNRLSVACVMFGYPGLGLLDASANALPSNTVRGAGTLYPDPGPARITVPPGGGATFTVQWSPVPTGGETSCPTAATLLVTPPDEYVALSNAESITACNGGLLRVTAVRAAT